MRGSPFQNLSVTEAYQRERHFREHQLKVQRAHPKIVAKDQMKQSRKLLKSFHTISS